MSLDARKPDFVACTQSDQCLYYSIYLSMTSKVQYFDIEILLVDVAEQTRLNAIWSQTRRVCGIKPEDVATVRSSELLAKLEHEDLDLILREGRLRWFGHEERSSGTVRIAFDIKIEARRGQGGPS